MSSAFIFIGEGPWSPGFGCQTAACWRPPTVAGGLFGFGLGFAIDMWPEHVEKGHCLLVDLGLTYLRFDH